MANDFRERVVFEFDLTDATKATDLVKGLQRAVAETTSELPKLEKGLQRLTGTQEKAAASTKRIVSDQDKFIGQLPRLRYALYDVATTYGVLSTALLGTATAMTVVGAKFESAFTQVERTLQIGVGTAGIERIRQELIDLSQQIPLTFDEIAKIAQLGNQLGIAAADVTKFTETVAQFSAITGISAEQTALAFGQLGNLLGVAADDYDRLGSSIALVGVNSAATESQIIAVAREIAPAARAAGFAADEVIGLSGALSSIRVPPERSRSTILQFFETLNMAVANGGKDLENFAAVVGVTASDLDSMVRSGQGESILRRFVDRAAASDTVEITQALQELGLAGLRVNPTIRALSNNTELLNQTFADGARGWAENIELQRQYGMIVDDLASQFQILINNLNAIVATITRGAIPGFAGLLKVINDTLASVQNFLDSDFGRTVGGMVVTATALAGAFLAIRSASFLATASVAALVTATNILGAGGLSGGIRGLAGVLLGVGTSASTAAVGVGTLTTALRLLGRATVVLGLLQVGMDAIAGDTSKYYDAAAGVVEFAATGIDALGQFAQVIGTTASTLGSFLSILAGPAAGLLGPLLSAGGNLGGDGLRSLAANIRSYGSQFRKSADTMTSSGLPEWFEDTSYAGGDLSGVLDDVGSSAAGAAAKVYTLVDYANDLSSVFSRSFDIRFASTLAIDALADSFQALTDRIEKARREIAGLQAQRSQLDYFLMVAENYGDVLRAAEIRAEIAELNAKIAETEAEASTELKGNTKAGRANRKAITDLVKQYESYITALAASGADQSTLNAAVAQSRSDFLAQAQALGFAGPELVEYTAHFDDLAVAIDTIPRNITVNANADPALQALNEFFARAKESIGSGISVPISASIDNSAAISQLQAQLSAAQSRQHALMYDGGSGQELAQLIRSLQAQIASLRGYASGGFTGRGGVNAPAGVVHRGEYVIPQRGVNQSTGLPRPEYVAQLTRGSTGSNGGYAGGGHVRNSGPMLVQLVASDLHRLASGQPIILSVDGKQLAATVNSTNQMTALRGGN